MISKLVLSTVGAFLVAQWSRICLPVEEMQETRVPSLHKKDPLEEEMATHSSILAWKIPWIEKPGGHQSRGVSKESYLTVRMHTHTHTMHFLLYLRGTQKGTGLGISGNLF